jgi:ribosomal protein S18 acetylase RimI-like enzyme
VVLSLRSCKPEDFQTLYEIDQACYDPAIAYSRRELRNYLRFPGADCVVAEADGKAAGFVITAHTRPWGYIVTIDVLDAYRRHGIGSMLLREIEHRLAANGVRRVSLETATDNASAIAFWQKHGYRTQGVKEGYYPGGRDAFTMSKVLT